MLSLILAIFVQTCIAGYVLEDDYSKDAFFGNFTPFTDPDPTNGFVVYQSYENATQQGLMASVSNYGSANYMGVDNTSISDAGRPSMRISSTKTYNRGLFIADIAHMPVGCGTWPAYWLVGPNWPTGGEIDIIEGVNLQAANQMTLHTNAGCTIGTTGMASTSTVNTTNCDTNAANQQKNAGCSVMSQNTQSFGSGFNAIGGGVYATEWTSQYINIHFFPRSSIPSDITSGTPNPSSWGTPMAHFAGNCDIDQHFTNMNIVFDTTLCGQWAGAEDVWGASSCATTSATCNAHVQVTPSAFTEAYWLINGVQVYQETGSNSRTKRGVGRREIVQW